MDAAHEIKPEELKHLICIELWMTFISTIEDILKCIYVCSLWVTRLTWAKCRFYKLWGKPAFLAHTSTLFCFLISLWRWMRQFSHLVYVSNVYSCLNKFVFLLVIFLLFSFFLRSVAKYVLLIPYTIYKSEHDAKKSQLPVTKLLLSRVLPS